MARYIKANPLVAQYLQLEDERNKVSDGNYLLWQNDMLKFGPLTQLNDILVKIGGIALMPHEARSEQDGTICRPLPRATDARFQQPIKDNVNDAIVGGKPESTEHGSDDEGENTESTDNEGSINEGQANEENVEGDQPSETSESEQTESETQKVSNYEQSEYNQND
jgi:hypothetical protein